MDNISSLVSIIIRIPTGNGMENMIYFGARYGFSIFNQEVTRYSVHTLRNYWNESLIGTQSDILTSYQGRSAHWLEGILGIKVELFKHFYAGASLRFRLLTLPE